MSALDRVRLLPLTNAGLVDYWLLGAGATMKLKLFAEIQVSVLSEPCAPCIPCCPPPTCTGTPMVRRR